MKQRIPHKVLLAAGKKAEDVPRVERPPAEAGDSAREFVGATESEMGLEATLRRFEDSEVHAHRTYREAVESGDETRAVMAERSFTKLAAEKVKVEQKVREARLASRDLVPRMEAEARISEVHGDLVLRLRGLSDSVCRAYGLPVSAEAEAKWLELVDDFFETLREEVLS